MTDKTELMKIETKSVLAAFSTGDGLDQVINEARTIVDNHEPDLKTDKGRKAIASLAHKVSKLKVKIDDTGKGLVADWKSKSKLVDASRRHLREELDKLRDEARQPLTDWEYAEELRKETHRAAIRHINDSALPDFEGELYSIEGLIGNLSKLELIKVDDSFDEYELDARRAKEIAVPKLQKLIADKKENIAKDEELERLRTEKSLRDRLERDEKLKHAAAESARIEAEQKAQQKIAQIEKEKQDAVQALKDAERAKSDAIKATDDAVKKAKADALQDAKEKSHKEQEALERREANKRHVGKIRREAKEALMKIVDESAAKKIILAIDAGDIPHTRIHY